MLAGLVDFALAFVLFVVMMIYYRVAPTAHTVISGAGVGDCAVCARCRHVVAALNVKYRDVRFASLPDPALAVCVVGDPAFERVAAEVSVFVDAESDVGNYRGIPLGALRTSLRLARIRHRDGNHAAVLFYAIYSFARVERSFADII